MDGSRSRLMQLRQFAGRHAPLLVLALLLAALAPSLSVAAAAPADADCETCHTLASAGPCLMTPGSAADVEPAVPRAAPRESPPAPAAAPVLLVLPAVPALAAGLPADGVAAAASPTARSVGQLPLHLLLGRLRN